MSGQKKPVFGIISLVLMLGLILTGVLIVIYEPAPGPAGGGDDSLAVVIENVASIVATLLVIAAVSLSSIILSGVSLLRREPRWPAAISLCLSLSALTMVVISVINL